MAENRFKDVVFRKEDGNILDRLRIKGRVVLTIPGVSFLAGDANTSSYVQARLRRVDPDTFAFYTKRDGTLIVREG